MKELKDTIEAMTSDDWNERLKAEIWQTGIRYKKLYDMLQKWDTLEFKPVCPRGLLERQLAGMEVYYDALKQRAKIEGVEIIWD